MALTPTRGEFPAAIAYPDFLASKRLVVRPKGVHVDGADLHDALFPFQRELVRWALRKGRAAIFADTGLGKTLMQLAWAQKAAERTLILAPLSVSRQTVEEGHRWGIEVGYAHSQSEATGAITITNYERLDRFDPSTFGAVVLDESSILKAFEGKTRNALIAAFRDVPMRLACTATPAPNDIAEIANHAEFLGVMSRVEMLAAFFVHDDEGWRLKGHAREPFWRWLASWGMSVKRPSDLGYSDEGYILPNLAVTTSVLPVEFEMPAKGIVWRAKARKATLEARVEEAVRLIAAEPDESWIAWCGLNDEGRELASRIPGAVLVEGQQSAESKADALLKFANGETRILVTKPSIAGFGLNLQRCARMVFVGLSDSYESYYQSIRRCWRFGQTREVQVHVVLGEPERPILDNVNRKELEADAMTTELVRHVAAFERDEIATIERGAYVSDTFEGPSWRLALGDSAERLKDLADESVDLSVFSPPFASLYTYSPSERDLGNSSSEAQFFTHFGFVTSELLRVTRAGRLAAVHVAQIPTTKANEGVIGMRDFRGSVIQHFIDAGFIYHGEVCIDKNPQAQAIRTHAKGLLFNQLRKDASWMRPALGDYILLFRKPGDNAVPVVTDITNDDWIAWAHPVWFGIRESDTLNVRQARSEKDERHICPLQLGVIERCIRLWSNKGETILDPFAGIGSTGVVAIRHGRKFEGVELKPEYAAVARRNLDLAQGTEQVDLEESVA